MTKMTTYRTQRKPWSDWVVWRQP